MTAAAMTLCNQSGRAIAEVDGEIVSIADRLNSVGLATANLTYGSAPHNQLYAGQRFVIQLDNGLPDFGGVIVRPLGQNSDSLSVRIAGPGKILEWRRTSENMSVSGTRGGIVESLLNYVNAADPTGITALSFATVGSNVARTYSRKPLADIITELADVQYWKITTDLIAGNVEFSFYWMATPGADLTESVLLAPDDVRSDRQDPIRNYITAVGDGITTVAASQASITKHGRREHVLYFTDISSSTYLQYLATDYLSKYAWGFHRLTCYRVPEPYNTYNVGDAVTLNAHMDKGDWALDIPVRVLAREWSPVAGCTLEVEEIL